MPNYPTSRDDDSSLYVAVNNKRTQLTSDITDSDLVIPVITTSGFPTSGFITILSNPDDITQAEAIEYNSITPTTFSATQRGAGDTPALSHDSGDNVDLTIVAAHHNELKDAIIALQDVVGVSGSENFPRFDAAGNIIVPGNVTALSGTFSDSLTISGIPVSIGGSGGSNIDDINGISSGSVVIEGAGDVNTTTVGNTITVSGSQEFPSRGNLTFTTSNVPSKGGSQEINQSFNNRSLVTKFKVVPNSSNVISTVEVFKRDTFSADVLEYKATTSGIYIDNVVWYHEDLDQTSELHLKITNNSLVDSTFNVELLSEVFG
ncbi:MAG: hypothetical protein GF334_01885 [Candidatus Altiarchaeales archaeon]|nr:hypothetical protein [Candidatus Altiarchaeales archaeon]